MTVRTSQAEQESTTRRVGLLLAAVGGDSLAGVFAVVWWFGGCLWWWLRCLVFWLEAAAA